MRKEELVEIAAYLDVEGRESLLHARRMSSSADVNLCCCCCCSIRT